MGISKDSSGFLRLQTALALPFLFLLAGFASADQPPNQGFSAAPKAIIFPSDQIIGAQNPALGVSVTLNGSGSSDSNGLPLTYKWIAGGNVIGKTPVIQVTLSAPGTYFYTLTVSNGGATATAIATVKLVIDTTPPLVDAPDLTVGFTEDGGARGSASPALHDYLTGKKTSATDAVTANPTFDGVQVNGILADDNTLLPLGDTTVTVAYHDGAGNRGTATSIITVSDKMDNDIFVYGASADSCCFNAMVYRVRGGQVEEYCQPTQSAPFSQSDLIVDSAGRVVFESYLGFFVGFPFGLFRCNTKGAPPESLAEFKTGTAGPQSGLEPPEAFPGMRFNSVGSLHLERVRSVQINDAVNNGAPQVVTEDAYVFAERPAGAVCADAQAIRYRVDSKVWEGPGGTIPDPIQGSAFGCSNLPYMVAHGGATYSSDGGTIRQTIDPLRLDASGTVNVAGSTVNFDVSLSLFGGDKEIPGGIIVHDVTLPTVPSGCPPPPPSFPISDEMPTHLFGPGAFSILTERRGIFYDEYTGNGLIAVDDQVSGPGAVATIFEQLFSDDPLEQELGLFRNGATGGCGISNSVFTDGLIPYFKVDPITGQVFSNPSGTIASAPNGLYFLTADTPGHVDKVAPPGFSTVATLPVSGAAGNVGAGGIGAFPPGTPAPSGLEIYVRVDSPVDVLATDPNGKRIGVLNGQPVNDYGNSGFDSGPSEPRFFAIRNPASGDFLLQSVGTGTGPFTVHVYSVNLDKKYGNHISQSGMAMPGSMGNQNFTLAPDGGITFTNHPPVAIAGPNQTVTAGTNGTATVTLDGSASTDPDGATLTFLWAGPFGLVSGVQPMVTLPVGPNVLQLMVDDGRGGTASANVTITVNPPADTTPPVVTPPASISIPATEAAGARGSASASLAAFLAGGSAVDVDDPSVTHLSPQVRGTNVDNSTLFPLGTTVVTFRFADAAGNVGSATASVIVALGTPRLSGTIAGKGRDGSGNYFVDVAFTNNGTGNGRTVQVTRLALRTLSGTGAVAFNSALSGALPLSLGNLDAGASTTMRFFLSVPSTVTRFSVTESGTLQDVAGTVYAYSLAQAVIPKQELRSELLRD